MYLAQKGGVHEESSCPCTCGHTFNSYHVSKKKTTAAISVLSEC
jgi:hypothetical protein